jgi:hypothetical protein
VNYLLASASATLVLAISCEQPKPLSSQHQHPYTSKNLVPLPLIYGMTLYSQIQKKPVINNAQLQHFIFLALCLKTFNRTKVQQQDSHDT